MKSSCENYYHYRRAKSAIGGAPARIPGAELEERPPTRVGFPSQASRAAPRASSGTAKEKNDNGLMTPHLRTITIARDIAEEEAADAYDALKRGGAGAARGSCGLGARSRLRSAGSRQSSAAYSRSSSRLREGLGSTGEPAI